MFKVNIEEVEICKLISSQNIDKKKVDKITNSIKVNGFDYNEGYIFVSKDYRIINGNHRYNSLLKLNYKYKTIKVKKVNVSKNFYIGFFFTITFFLIFFLTKIIIFLINEFIPN